MSLPPLLFRGEDKLDDWRPVSLGDPADEAVCLREVASFPKGIFGCCNSPRAGFDCCCGVLCCGPCTWRNAMKLVDIDATFAAVATAVADFARGRHGDQTAFGAASGIAAAFWSGDVRQKLYTTLYPTKGNPERYCTSVLCHACCMPCAYAQEIDAVAVYYEGKDEKGKLRLIYGRTTDCLCMRLVFEDDPTALYDPGVSVPGAPTLFRKQLENGQMDRL